MSGIMILIDFIDSNAKLHKFTTNEKKCDGAACRNEI
jgi:hypothetical protein